MSSFPRLGVGFCIGICHSDSVYRWSVLRRTLWYIPIQKLQDKPQGGIYFILDEEIWTQHLSFENKIKNDATSLKNGNDFKNLLKTIKMNPGKNCPGLSILFLDLIENQYKTFLFFSKHIQGILDLLQLFMYCEV